MKPQKLFGRMIKMKKILLAAVLTFALVLSSFTVFADSNQSILSKATGLSDDEISELRTQRIGYGQLIPATVLSEMLDMDIKDVIELRQAGKTFYQIAVEKGIAPEDYKSDLLEKKNEYVDEQVKSGSITEDQGNLLKERMKTNIDGCNGQGGSGMGRNMGRNMGKGMGRSFR